jgi:hypothetical protein
MKTGNRGDLRVGAIKQFSELPHQLERHSDRRNGQRLMHLPCGNLDILESIKHQVSPVPAIRLCVANTESTIMSDSSMDEGIFSRSKTSPMKMTNSQGSVAGQPK